MVTVIEQLQGAIIPKYTSYLSSDILLKSVDFIIKSCLQHFHLYHFLLTQPQTTDLTTVDLYIDAPTVDPPSLQDGVEEKQWLKIKKKQEIDLEYKAKVEQFEVAVSQATSQAEANLELAYKEQLTSLPGGSTKVSEENAATIISTLIKAHLDASSVSVSQCLQKQGMDLEYRLEQLEVVAPPPPEHKEATPRGSSRNSSRNQSRNL